MPPKPKAKLADLPTIPAELLERRCKFFTTAIDWFLAAPHCIKAPTVSQRAAPVGFFVDTFRFVCSRSCATSGTSTPSKV